MKKNNIQLDKINFHFVVNGEQIIVQWLFLGRSFVASIEYPSVYKVWINYKEGGSYTTSLQANISNSKMFLAKVMKEQQVTA